MVTLINKFKDVGLAVNLQDILRLPLSSKQYYQTKDQ